MCHGQVLHQPGPVAGGDTARHQVPTAAGHREVLDPPPIAVPGSGSGSLAERVALTALTPCCACAGRPGRSHGEEDVLFSLSSVRAGRPAEAGCVWGCTARGYGRTRSRVAEALHQRPRDERPPKREQPRLAGDATRRLGEHDQSLRVDDQPAWPATPVLSQPGRPK